MKNFLKIILFSFLSLLGHSQLFSKGVKELNKYNCLLSNGISIHFTPQKIYFQKQENILSTSFIYSNLTEASVTKSGDSIFVSYPNLYNGITLQYLLIPNKSYVKYEFHVEINADYRQIQWKYNSDNTLNVGQDGKLNILGNINYKEQKPYSYSQKTKTEIASNFKIKDNTVSFELGSYNASEAIIIDP